MSQNFVGLTGVWYSHTFEDVRMYGELSGSFGMINSVLYGYCIPPFSSNFVTEEVTENALECLQHVGVELASCAKLGGLDYARRLNCFFVYTGRVQFKLDRLTGSLALLAVFCILRVHSTL